MTEFSNLEIEMIQGPFNSISTQVFVRTNPASSAEDNLDGQSAWQAGWRITGQIVGPYCVHSETLPAVIAFQDQGDGEGLLAAARIPDPCAWTARLPATYKVDIELMQAGKCKQQSQHLFTFRANEIRQNSFYQTDLNGNYRRWVLRCVQHPLDDVLSDGGEQFREEGLACIVINPTAEQCNLATLNGVAILSIVQQSDAEKTISAIEKINAWGSVMACIIDGDVETKAIDLNNVRIPIGCRVSDISKPLPAWAQFCIMDVANISDVSACADWQKMPVIVSDIRSFEDCVTARNQCAGLQKDVAAEGDYAGYCIFTTN
ncbi:MAG: hypothetical protein HOB73_02610 [Planctomycetaceae bacterium]|jgi:hypothetical protein|nr:hypothetical protein [Planctomycetaceae bacterium]